MSFEIDLLEMFPSMVEFYPTNEELGGEKAGKETASRGAFAAAEKTLTDAGASSAADEQHLPQICVDESAGEPRRVTLAAKKKLHTDAGASSAASEQICGDESAGEQRRVTRAAMKKLHTDAGASSAASEQICGDESAGEPRRVTRAAMKKLHTDAGASSDAADEHPPRTSRIFGGETPPPKTDILAHIGMIKKKARSPSVCPIPIPPAVLDSTRLRGVLSSLDQRQLITIIARAYKNHPDVRDDVSVRASEVERKVYIHNLPLDSTPVSVELAFSVFGTIEDIVILHSKLDKDTRRGYVLFENMEGAAEAVASRGLNLVFVCHAAQEGCCEKCLF